MITGIININIFFILSSFKSINNLNLYPCLYKTGNCTATLKKFPITFAIVNPMILISLKNIK